MEIRKRKALAAKRECLFFLLLFITFFGFGQLRKAPDWVHKTPISDQAYYGVGSIDKVIYPEYRAKARKMALREIAEKIFVSINSESTLTMRYENDQVDYLMDETVSLASTNFLSGHQKVAEWTDKRSDTYYVLYKLDLDIYKARQAGYFEALEELITLMQTEASTLFEMGEVARGISKLSEAIIRLDVEMNRMVEPEYRMEMQNWQLASIYELEQEIDQIGFILQPRYEFYALSRAPLTISEFLIDRCRAIPVNGLNMSLNVIHGDIFRYTFGNDHQEALKIYGMFPENGTAVFQIEAELRLDNRVRKLLDPSIKTRFTSPPAAIAFAPYTIAFDDFHDTSLSTNQMRAVTNFFRTITTDLGLQEVTDNPDYRIAIQPKGDLIRQTRGTFRGTISLDVTIYDPKSNREVFGYVLPDVKINQTEDAIPYVLRNYVNRSDELLVRFVTFLCALQL